jgi:hypothetical protein
MERPSERTPGAVETMVSWIPSDKAKKGKIVRLKEFPSDPEWSEGWKVMEVWGKRDGETVEKNADLWKHQREASDI